MRVLMGADGSQQGTESLRAACRLLAGMKPEVDVVCAAPAPRMKDAGWRHRMERRAKRIAERVGKALSEESIHARPAAHAGSPARALIRCSPSYDLVVVAANSHRDGAGSGMGPVATRVMEHSPVSVLAARPGPSNSPPKILVPLDGSDSATEGLAKLQSLVDVPAEVTLLHVIESHWVRSAEEPEWLEEDEPPSPAESDWEREFTREAEVLLEQARDQLPARTAVNTLIYEGVPADEILTEANSGDYDLVVLSASGEQDLKHRILGSVSAKVAWNAPCSVLLLR